ncbi:MAG: hypothetical protein AB1578_12440 [Thermodesulfobacteriota bacterium]
MEATIVGQLRKRRNSIIFVFVTMLAVVYPVIQAWTFYKSKRQLEYAMFLTDKCVEAGEEVDTNLACRVLPGASGHLDDLLADLVSPLRNIVKKSDEYEKFRRVYSWPIVQINIAKADAARKQLQQQYAQALEFAKVIEEAEARRAEERKRFRQEYDELGPPKLLYSCNDEVKYIVGKGIANYNGIYLSAKEDCGADKLFKIIHSEK